MKTKTAVLYKTGDPLVLEELEIPSLREGQTLVKILYSGICRSQINEINALKGPDKYLPHTLGHEASAIVKQVGSKVTKVKPEDYVVVSWIKGSGYDEPFANYLKGEKKINAGAAATFSQYALISENRLTKISKKIPQDVAALFGCALPTGGGIILNEIPEDEDKDLAILGIGGIGSSALLVASHLRNFSKIIAVDINNYKLDYATKLGATHTINAFVEDPIRKIFALTNGKGVDYAIETAGSKKAMESAFKILKEGIFGREGGLEIIAGNIPKDQNISIHPYELIKGKRIKGSWGGNTNPDKDFPIYEEAYLKGRLPLEKLITHKFNFDEINLALKKLEGGEIIRALINIGFKN